MVSLNDNEDLAVPRQSGKQIMRSNHPTTSVSQYYYRSLFVPYIDHLLAELDRRFEGSLTVAQGNY